MRARGLLLKTCVTALAAISLAACGSAGPSIGSTVKGTRVAVMARNKNVESDKDLKGQKPQLPQHFTNTSWAQAGYNITHMMPNADISAHPKEIWSRDMGAGSSSDFKLLARPVVFNNTVFTMDSKGVVNAFDSATGDRKWDFDTTPEDVDDSAIGGGVGADGDTLYATTGFGEVLALDGASGKVKWRRALMNPLRAAPTIAGGRVYAVSIDNQISALDAKTGDVLWHHNGIAESATLMGASNPAVVEDSVVVAYTSGEIFNLRTENGRVSWSYALTTATQGGALPAIADIRGLPVIDHGHVFAVSHSGRMASIDRRTGDRDWEADVGGINTPLVAGDTIYVLTTDGQLVALVHDSGRILWVHDMQHLADPSDHDSDPVFWTGPILGGNRLWLTNSLGELVSFSPDDGSQIEKIDLGDPSYMPPIIANGIMYVVTDDGTLTALR